MEDEIEWVVRRLRSNRSGCTSGIRVEHLRVWSREARKVEEAAEAAAEKAGETEVGTATVAEAETVTVTKEMYHLQKVVALVKADFQEGRLVEDAT